MLCGIWVLVWRLTCKLAAARDSCSALGLLLATGSCLSACQGRGGLPSNSRQYLSQQLPGCHLHCGSWLDPWPFTPHGKLPPCKTAPKYLEIPRGGEWPQLLAELWKKRSACEEAERGAVEICSLKLCDHFCSSTAMATCHCMFHPSNQVPIFVTGFAYNKEIFNWDLFRNPVFMVWPIVRRQRLFLDRIQKKLYEFLNCSSKNIHVFSRH